VPTALSQPYFDALARGVLAYQQCQHCDTIYSVAHAACLHCGSTELQWLDSSGEGVVTTFTVNYRPAHPAWAHEVPYAVGLITLKEGFRSFGRLLGADPNAWSINMPVKLIVLPAGPVHLPAFTQARDTR
jgi:uncharacterized OB-fold protein